MGTDQDAVVAITGRARWDLVVVGLCWAALATAFLMAAEPKRAGIERALLEGEVVDSEPLGTGVTRSERVWLEHEGLNLSAVFKSVDVRRRGRTRFASGRSELNFSDSYRYERAAYLLDQLLGLEMVPVTVVRRVGGEEGALTHWIANAITEHQRIEQGLRPRDMRELLDQWADMRLFDVLIANTDRHAGNQLYTLEDWRLRLIDHSRAFRKNEELPEEFAARPTTLTRSTAANLEGLEEESLSRLLRGLLGRDQIRSLLRRRDLLLEKVERDLLEYGEAYVYREDRAELSR